MRFALVDGKQVEAKIGLKGTCRGCGASVIAKCGSIRVPHWAHRAQKVCDQWWEPETEWHRNWKDQFPAQWQEVFLPDPQTGEKHIADIRTEHGVIIEFQHSYLDSQERKTRENFYRKMIWVVDGGRLKNDYIRFFKKMKKFCTSEEQKVFLIERLDEWFSLSWIGCQVPVIFDFRSAALTEINADEQNYLYCLIPVRLGRHAILFRFHYSEFIKGTNNGEWFSWARQMMASLNRLIYERYVKDMVSKRQQSSQSVLTNRRSKFGRSRIF